MLHFLLGLDAVSVFMTPYATVTTDPGFFAARGKKTENLGSYIVRYGRKTTQIGFCEDLKVVKWKRLVYNILDLL